MAGLPQLRVADMAVAVAESADKNLNLLDATLGDEYFYASLPLCVIDAVFSIGVNYAGTKNTVIRWAKSQEPNWPIDRREANNEHTVEDFINALSSKTSDQLASAIFCNRQRTSARGGILKADAVGHFAHALLKAGINSFKDMSDEKKLCEAEKYVKEIKGQGSGISFDYFTLLAGNEDMVKADRMLCRFVADAIGVEVEKLPPSLAKETVINAAGLLKPKYSHITPRLLDFEIWSFRRQKDTQKPMGATSIKNIAHT